jgi:hypothetical protein
MAVTHGYVKVYPVQQVNPFTNLDHFCQRSMYSLLSHLADAIIQIHLQ